jgi:hypothetical protein
MNRTYCIGLKKAIVLETSCDCGPFGGDLFENILWLLAAYLLACNIAFFMLLNGCYMRCLRTLQYGIICFT